jgi:hypothetical protein
MVKRPTGRALAGLILVAITTVASILLALDDARAQTPGAMSSSFFELARPGRLDFTLFGGGYTSDQYETTQEGLQVNQSITRSIGLVGRVTGYQLFIGNPFANPLNLKSHEARLNFGRLQAGVDLSPIDGTDITLLGGGDVGDSYAASVEGDISTWVLSHSKHPVNLAASTAYNNENTIVTSEIGLRCLLRSTDSYLFLVGAGGAIFSGASAHAGPTTSPFVGRNFVFLATQVSAPGGISGQGGPIVELYLPRWNFGFDLEAGYGDAKQYGQLTIFKQLSWFE